MKGKEQTHKGKEQTFTFRCWYGQREGLVKDFGGGRRWAVVGSGDGSLTMCDGILQREGTVMFDTREEGLGV